MAHHDFGAVTSDALVIEPVGDGLRLSDDAETGSGGNRNASVAFVLATGDQRMQRSLKAKRRGVRGNVVNPSVGDQERAGDPIDWNVRQRRGQRTEQFSAIGLAIGLAGLDYPHLQSLDLLQAIDQRLLCVFGLAGAVTEALAGTFVDDDGGGRRQRFAILAGERWVGERQQDQDERRDAYRRAACAAEQQHCCDHRYSGGREPKHQRGNQRRKRDTVLHLPALLSQPLDERGRMHQVGLIVSGQGVHHDVDPGAKSEFALSRLTRRQWQHRLPVRTYRPGARKVV